MLNACVNVWKKRIFKWVISCRKDIFFPSIEKCFSLYREKIGFSLASVECVFQFTKTLYEKKHVNGLCSRLFNIFIFFFLCLSKRCWTFRRGKEFFAKFLEFFKYSWRQCELRKVNGINLIVLRISANKKNNYYSSVEISRRVPRISVKWFLFRYRS